MNEEKIRTGACEIWVDGEGFIRVHILKDLDLKDMEEAYKVFSTLGLGPGRKKGLELLTGTGFYSLTKAARDYAGKHGRDYFTAAALVTDSIVLRFFMKMFNAMQNQKEEVPFRAFNTVDEAKEWLRGFKNPV